MLTSCPPPTSIFSLTTPWEKKGRGEREREGKKGGEEKAWELSKDSEWKRKNEKKSERGTEQKLTSEQGKKKKQEGNQCTASCFFRACESYGALHEEGITFFDLQPDS